MSSKRSRVHPKYKTKCRVRNWSAYDRSLVARGDLTVWITPEALEVWRPAPTGCRGAQPKFSDLAIETALTLRMVFHLPLRQAEGFLRSILRIMRLDLESPDHTTLSRRGQRLPLDLRAVPHEGPLHLLIDSSGLSAYGEGAWAAAKHGAKGRRGWRKLHLSVDARGVILAHRLTNATADDANTALDLLDAIEGTITSVTADGAYDTTALYEAAAKRGARVVVPPSTAATSSRTPRAHASPRNRTIERVQEIGRRAWKTEAGYRQHAESKTHPADTRPSPAIAYAHEAITDAESRRASRAMRSFASPHSGGQSQSRLVRETGRKGPGSAVGGFMHQRPDLRQLEHDVPNVVTRSTAG